MSERRKSRELRERTEFLETRVRHLTNELALTKKEYETASKKYLELYSDMERTVLEKSRELKDSLQKLKQHNQIHDIILDSSPGMIYFKDSRGAFVEVNREFSRALGLSPGDIVGRTYAELFPGGRNAVLEEDGDVFASGLAETGRTAVIETARGEVPVIVARVPLKDIDGKVVGVVGFLQDIGELKRAEEEIRTSLKEKEILLKEIQHRVKNNLQVIASLIDMTSRKIGNREALDILLEIRNRVYTMALIHTMLYEGGRFDRIDMAAFVNRLLSQLLQVYRSEARITPRLECSGVYLPIKQAVPCGLVVNELVSNCFKHAFKGRERGEIRVSLAQVEGGSVDLAIADDGVGIGNGRGGEADDTLGMKLAKLLVEEQLKGSIAVRGGEGTRIDIRFQGGAG